MQNTDLYCLKGKGILVTGAARGIGRAVALGAAASGARVYAVDVSAESLAETTETLGEGHHSEVFDLADISGIPALCDRAQHGLGRLDGLAHVAAMILRRNSLEEITEEDWDRQLQVNLKATFFLDRAASALMNPGGSIVNFSSQGWWTGGFGGSLVYSATKGGVTSLTRGLARTLAPRGIRVNAIAPGAVETPMMSEGLSEQDREDFLRQVPLARMGRPDELANAVGFLLSDAASYITGATLNVSGGQLIY